MGYRIGGSNDILQLKMPTGSGGCYLYIRQTGYKSKVPMACSLALIHLLKLFTELRKPIYSHDQQFIVWTTQDQPGRRDAWDKVWGTVTVSMASGSLLSRNLHVCTHMEALWTWSLGVFMEPSLPRHDWINRWPLALDSSCSSWCWLVTLIF